MMENYWVLHSIVWNIFSTPLIFMFMISAYILWYNLVCRWLVGTDLSEMKGSWADYYNHQLHVDMLEEREYTLFYWKLEEYKRNTRDFTGNEWCIYLNLPIKNQKLAISDVKEGEV